MARDRYRGNALKDGYTCFGESPRTANATTFMSADRAEAFDEETERLKKETLLDTRSRRINWHPDDDYLD